MTKYKIKVQRPKLRPITVPTGIPTPDEIEAEIKHMYNVLLDREQLPTTFQNSLMLMEIADAFFARASEIKGAIQAMERKGQIRSGRDSKDPYYKLRTGEIETFLSVCDKSRDLGSRRMTAEQHEFNKSMRGLDGW